MNVEEVRELIYESKTWPKSDPANPDQPTATPDDLINRLSGALEATLPALYADCHLSRANLADYLGLADEKYLELVRLPAPDAHEGWRPETIASWDRTRTKREITQAEYEAVSKE